MKKEDSKKRVHRKKRVKQVKKTVKSYENNNAWIRGGINEKVYYFFPAESSFLNYYEITWRRKTNI